MTPLHTRSFCLASAVLLTLTVAAPAHARAESSVPRPSAVAMSMLRAEPSASDLSSKLQAAIDATNEDPEVHAPELREALDDVAAVPGVVGRSTKLQELRIEGLMYLARALLVLDQRDQAVAAIDEAIRVSGGSVPNVAAFGPSLADLYDERRAAPELRPAGEVHVACTGGPCRVFLDGRVIGTGTDIGATGIPLGAHIIRIEPQELEPPEPFQQEVIALTDAASKAEFTFTVPATDPPATGGPGPKLTGDSGRKLPRWAGILGMTIGGLAIAGGAFAMGIDGRCPDLSSTAKNDCVDVHDSLYTGIGVLAVGVATATGFGIAFGVGEAKDKRFEQKNTTANLQLGFRF